MKKIIFVTNYFGNGGAATVMKIISNSLVEDGNYEIQIIAFNDDEKKYCIPNGVQYKIIGNLSKNKVINKIKRIKYLRKILKNNKDSIIISFEYFVNMEAIIANVFLKNKMIISERNDPKRVGNNKRKMRNFLYQFADILVCQTPDAKAYFPKKIQDKATIIPNPIMDNLPNRYEGERNKNIITFCRVEKQKNLPMLIDAFEILHNEYPEYKLKIYGDGMEKNNLIKYAEQKGLSENIDFYKFEQNLHSKIIDSAMFVSSSDYEGISNSMLEAMAIGLPTICTNCPCGGAKMMIEDGINGILVPVGDCIKLYEVMKKVINDKELQIKLSLNSIKIREKISSDKICLEWKKLI